MGILHATPNPATRLLQSAMKFVQEISYLEVEYAISAQCPLLSNYPSQVQESKVHLQTCTYHLWMFKGGNYSLQSPSNIRDAHLGITYRTRLT